MRIALVIPVSSERGGAENLFDGLFRKLSETSHDVEKIQIPVSEKSWEDVMDAYERCYSLDLSDFDMVISTKAPTFMVRHQNHVCYLVHTMRVFYDMFEQEYGIGNRSQRRRQNIIHELDTRALKPGSVKKLFTIGNEVSKRLKHWNDIDSEVLHPPLSREGFYCNEYNYIFTASRLHRWKRIELIIKAMKHIRSDIKLKIAGGGEDENRLRALARGDNRIEFLGIVGDEELLRLYSNALVVPFVPMREDYGYITLEAMASRKPVITCTDSGEPTYFVKEFKTGFAVEPAPEAIAEKIDYFIQNPEDAKRMGAAGHDLIKVITWENVISKLVGEGEGRENKQSQRKIFVTDNQVLDPPVGGGRIRIYQLYKNIARNYDVNYVGAYDWPGPEYREQVLGNNFKEIIVPLTQIHFTFNSIINRLVKKKTVIDVTIPLLMRFTPRFREIAQMYASQSDIIIVSHPWVYPYINAKQTKRKFLIYDSHNCEYLIKKEILRSSMAGRLLSQTVKRLEKAICNESDLIFATSEEDKKRLSELYNINDEKIIVVPNGVDTNEIKPACDDEKRLAKEKLGLDGAKTIMFVGSPYQPNTEALEFIADKLTGNLKQFEFLIVGGVKQTFTRANVPGNLHMYGIVDNEMKNLIYKASDIAINPMFSGSGTNIKMFDYMSAGLPTISTVVGARGIDTNGDECFIVSKAEDFERNIIKLFNNPGLFEKLSLNGRKLVEDNYDWAGIADRAGSAMENKMKSEEAGKVERILKVNRKEASLSCI